MKFLQEFRDRFGLTSTENKVILFLVAAFVAGMGIRMFRSAWNPMPLYDYAASDSEFAVRSALAELSDSSRPNRDTAGTSAGQDEGSDSSAIFVNLNTAGSDELIALPGIGPAMAGRIIAYRNQHGKFTSVNDLSNVRGIGKKKLERLRPYITVEQ